MPTPQVSVIVPAHNAEATLAATLAALGTQEFDADFEVIVVDSASSDGTLAVARAHARTDPRLSVLQNPGGEPAGSRNLGIDAAAAPILAFTDADCEADARWLAAGLSAMEDTGADLLQGRVLPAGPHTVTDRTLSVGHESGLYETANLFVARDLARAVGGFAPLPGFAEDRPFGEDTWFAWRARRAGARTAFSAEPLVRHAVFPRGAAGYIAEQRRRRYFPALVAAVPELRDAFLHHRVFLSAQTARFDLAVAGLGAGALLGRRPVAALTALITAAPYLATLPRMPRAAAVQLAADAVGGAALLSASLATRSPVL